MNGTNLYANKMADVARCPSRNRRLIFGLGCVMFGFTVLIYQFGNSPPLPLCMPYDINDYEQIRLPTARPKQESREDSDLPLCPDIPPNLDANVNAEERIKELQKTRDVVMKNVQPGGTYIPPNCISRERLALVVPYRDREDQLEIFLLYMHAFLQKQQVHYTIIVAEMDQGTIFNTGWLQNVGFVTADRLDHFTCFVINDVDLIPTNENNLYRCEDVPLHLVHSNSKYNHTLLYKEYFGGALAMRREQYIQANGFSNLYFGWGKQDDDFEKRIRLAGIKWKRIPKDVGIYYHTKGREESKDKNPRNPDMEFLYKKAEQRMKCEGLNSLKYETKAIEFRNTNTWTLVGINEADVRKGYDHLLSSSFKVN